MMKALITLLIIYLTGFFAVCQAQINSEKSKTDTVKPMNLLNEQVKMYGAVFDLAGAGEDNPLGSSKSYSEAIENMDAPEELKEQLREMYALYEASLNSDKSIELKVKMEKILEEAAKEDEGKQ